MPDFLEGAKQSSAESKAFFKKTGSQLGLPISTITFC